MKKQVLKNNKGQTTVEYLLIIAVIVVVISVLGKNLQKGIGEITQQVMTGVKAKISNLMSAASQ